MRNPFGKPEFTIMMTPTEAQSVRNGKGDIVFLPEGCEVAKIDDIPIKRWAPLIEHQLCAVDESLDKWEGMAKTVAKEIQDQAQLRRVKALVFMRLNTARDKRDKKSIEIYREIQEAMR